MTKRINVLLPEATIRSLDRLAKSGERSQLISRAVDYYLATQSPEAVQRRLEAALIRDRDLDLETTADWSAVDNDTWQQLDSPNTSPRATRSAAKSSSRRSTRR